MTRVIGLDIHRVFAEAVVLDTGKIVPLGKIGMTRQHLRAFAHTLTHDDHVVIEATGNAAAVSEVLAPHVGRVVIANPRQVRLIAEARIKTDTIDATVLARLYASHYSSRIGRIPMVIGKRDDRFERGRGAVGSEDLGKTAVDLGNVATQQCLNLRDMGTHARET